MVLLIVGQEKSREYTNGGESENRTLNLHGTHRSPEKTKREVIRKQQQIK